MTGRPDPRAGRGPAPLAVHYFYDEPLPNRYASGIQILRTGAALAAAGIEFTFHAGTLAAPPEEITRLYGAAPSPLLAVRPFFPDRALPAPLRAGALRWRFAALLRKLRAYPGSSVLMTRGETAFGLLPALRAAGPDRPPLVYELHRLAALRHVERRSGRTAGADDLAARDAAAVAAREAAAVAEADALVFLTEEVAGAAAAEYRYTAPDLILPSGADLPSAPPEPGAEPDFDIVYAGKLEARKGAFDLVAAMAHLPGRSLAIAGGPDSAADALRAEAARLRLADRVRVLGWIEPAAVPGFLRRGRVGACPLRRGADAVSDRFSSPMKLLQMLALGVPVVATDIGPVRAVVADGREALLAPPNDPAALAAALGRLLDDPGLAARLAEAGRARAAEFAWPVRAGRLAAFLAGLPRHRARSEPARPRGRTAVPAPFPFRFGSAGPAERLEHSND